MWAVTELGPREHACEGQIAHQSRPKIQRQLSASGVADEDKAPVRLQGGERAGKRAPAHGIGDQIDTVAAGEAPNAVDDILGSGVDRGVEAEPLKLVRPIRARHGSDDARAASLGELHQRYPDVARATLDEHRLALAHASARVQALVSGSKRARGGALGRTRPRSRRGRSGTGPPWLRLMLHHRVDPTRKLRALFSAARSARD